MINRNGDLSKVKWGKTEKDGAGRSRVVKRDGQEFLTSLPLRALPTLYDPTYFYRHTFNPFFNPFRVQTGLKLPMRPMPGLISGLFARE